MKNKLEEFILCIENFNNLSKTELIDVIAYFFAVNNQVFSAKDIRECFDLLNLVQYSNVNAYLISNVNIKFLAKEKNSYTLTRNFQEELKKSFSNQKQLPTPSQNLFPKELLTGTRG